MGAEDSDILVSKLGRRIARHLGVSRAKGDIRPGHQVYVFSMGNERTWMKRTLQLAALVAALIIGLPLGIFIFHTGPPGISAGTDLVLARFALTNGTRLC